MEADSDRSEHLFGSNPSLVSEDNEQRWRGCRLPALPAGTLLA